MLLPPLPGRVIQLRHGSKERALSKRGPRALSAKMHVAKITVNFGFPSGRSRGPGPDTTRHRGHGQATRHCRRAACGRGQTAASASAPILLRQRAPASRGDDEASGGDSEPPRRSAVLLRRLNDVLFLLFTIAIQAIGAASVIGRPARCKGGRCGLGAAGHGQPQPWRPARRATARRSLPTGRGGRPP